MALPTIILENDKGQVLNLTKDPRYEPVLTGTGPPAATINRAKIATADGSRFNSATVGERNLLLTVYFKRDVARSRQYLYRFLATKKYVKVRYLGDDLDVYVEGYVETAEVDPWALGQALHASIICPQPYWRDTAEVHTNASIVSNLFKFPFAISSAGVALSSVNINASTIIENEGTVETGITFELVATVRSLQPRIYNLSTGEYIGFYVDLFPGERLVVCTIPERRSVTHISVDGVESNYINTVMEGSEWLQLDIGANEYSYTVDEGEMELLVTHTNMYAGV